MKEKFREKKFNTEDEGYNFALRTFEIISFVYLEP